MLADSKTFQRRHVLYCDVLGFSSYVESPFFETSRCFRLFHKLDELVQQTQVEIDPEALDPETGQKPDYVVQPEATYCSDSIIISLPPTSMNAMWLCEAAARLQNLICYSGFLLRGAIVTDDIYHSGNTIFGPAITRAVKLEKNAPVPSIIISPEVNNCFHTHTTPEEAEIVEIRSRQLISQFQSTTPFVDPFWLLKRQANHPKPSSHTILEIDTWRTRIEYGLQNNDPKVKVKYQWAAEFFNHSLCNKASNIKQITFD